MGEPVWIVESEVNHPVIAALWQERHDRDHTTGITSFRIDSGATPEDWLISQVAMIDRHFDEYSHAPPYSFLDVVGAPWSDRIEQALAEFGFFEHEITPEGFMTRRKLDKRPSHLE
jgi:hypothetical protein